MWPRPAYYNMVGRGLETCVLQCCDPRTSRILFTSIARSEPDGTRRRTGGEVKGKDANGVGSQ